MQQLTPTTSVLSVSKLCCPVCNHLLSVLKTLPADFAIRGHHDTLYQVELPPWLPEDILKKMLDKFQGILLQQLISMMKPQTLARKKYAKARSTESQNVSDGEGNPRSSFDSLYSDGE
jgi:hypothetical protein